MQQKERNVDWTYYPSSPIEMLEAEWNYDAYHHRLFVCAGTVAADEEDEGDLVRVWVPDESTHARIPSFLKEQINEKHGKYAEKEELSELDGFTESISYKNWK